MSDRTDQSALRAVGIEVLKLCAAAAIPTLGALWYIAGLETRVTLLERTQVTAKDLETVTRELRSAMKEELAPIFRLLERHDGDIRSLDARLVRHEAQNPKGFQQ